MTFFEPLGRPGSEGGIGLFSNFFVTLGPKGPKGSVTRPRVLKPFIDVINDVIDVCHCLLHDFNSSFLIPLLSSCDDHHDTIMSIVLSV